MLLKKTVPIFLILLHSSLTLHAGLVKIKKISGNWTLLVDGHYFLIKGVGCNVDRGSGGEDYLRMAKDMGANTVRTWGFTPRSYFDAAEKQGLKVCAGVWFNPIRSGMSDSYQNPSYCEQRKIETLDHVKEMKSHPALLFWNLGNEVFTFTESNEEKMAFGKFLEDLVLAVRQEDPDHPVIYASAGSDCLSFLKQYVPSLDIVGVNTYGGFLNQLSWLDRNGYDKPVVATEFGPIGEWGAQNDTNGLPYDPADQFKAHNYANMWKDIRQKPSHALGGFAFVLGDSRNQASWTWYNINVGEKKRQSYWTLHESYTGHKAKNIPPKIKLLRVDRVKDLGPGEVITAKVDASDPEGDALIYDYKISAVAGDPLTVTPPVFFNPQVEIIGPGEARLHVPTDPGHYRIYALVEDGRGNIAVANRSITVKTGSH